jgi:KUP system potassium uptake protein
MEHRDDKHNKILPKQVVIIRVETEEIPRVSASERIDVQPLKNGFFRLTVRYGFAEDPNLPEVLSRVKAHGLNFKPMETSYFPGRERILATDRKGMAIWRERLFALMSRNALPATYYFQTRPTVSSNSGPRWRFRRRRGASRYPSGSLSSKAW